VAKANSLVDIGLLEHCIREELNTTAERRLVVLDPILVTITNYPEDKTEYFEVSNNPSLETSGVRKLPFTRRLYIERSDFEQIPPPKYQRLKPDGEVRLMGAYIIRCDEVICDENGQVTELMCSYDPDTGGKNPADGRKVKGTIHWVSAAYGTQTTVRLYDHLFTLENTGDIPEDKSFDDYINPTSMTELKTCIMEPGMENTNAGERFQFVRMGYFCKDSKNTNTFNRIVTLKDSWAKASQK